MSAAEKPNDTLLERDIIASCIADPSTIGTIGVGDNDFALEAHRLVWGAMQTLHELGESVTLVAIRSRLIDCGQLEQVGGERFLGTLRLSVVQNDKLPIGRLRSMTHLRSVRQAAMAVVEMAETGKADETTAALATAHSAALRRVQKQRTQNALELCMALLEEMDGKRGVVVRIHPGYELLEKHVGSLPIGSTIAILASTNVGKSGYLLEMLVRAADRNVCSGYVSVEDQEQVVCARLVAMASTVSSRRIMHRRWVDGDKERIARGFGYIDSIKSRMHVSILQGGTENDVCAAMSELALRGCKLIAVDYLQKISSSKDYKSRAHEVASIASRITSHAQHLGVVCVLASQCTREKTRLNECPSKHDMKESGDLENMVDVIVGLWREYEDDFAPIWARLLKVKWGGVGQSWSLARDESGRIHEVEGSDRRDPPDASGAWAHRGKGKHK